MSEDLYIALSGAVARLRELEVVANNLANADTIGFKRDRASFSAAFEQALVTGDRAALEGAGVFAAAGQAGADFSSGAIEQTGSPLDVAISGPGFFEIVTDDGPRYTRAGSFAVNAAGQLATSDGQPVAGASGPIGVGERAVEILRSGAVVQLAPDGAAPVEVGRLRIVEFDDPGVLVKQGANLFDVEGDVAPVQVSAPTLVERSLERSNVLPVQELGDLIMIQRSFDIAMRMIQTDSELSQRLIQEITS